MDTVLVKHLLKASLQLQKSLDITGVKQNILNKRYLVWLTWTAICQRAVLSCYTLTLLRLVTSLDF